MKLVKFPVRTFYEQKGVYQTRPDGRVRELDLTGRTDKGIGSGRIKIDLSATLILTKSFGQECLELERYTEVHGE